MEKKVKENIKGKKKKIREEWNEKSRTHRTLRGNRGAFHGKGDAVESDEEEH